MDIIAAFITALIAFLGATATYFLQRAMQRRSVNIAVLAEVQRLIKVLEAHRKFRHRYSDGESEIPLIPFTMSVYSSQIGNIGVLHREIVADVVRFYGYIDFLNALQTQQELYQARDNLKGFDATYDKTLETVVESFSTAFNQAFVRYGLSQ